MPMPAPIGLLGGTFDPIHVGHLALARCALDQLALGEVRFVPTASPWQKGNVTPAAHRVQMVRIAIGNEPRFSLDTIEVDRGGASYTIDTLRELRARLGPDVPLVLIIGGDQYANLDTWRDWRALTGFAHIAVAHRNGVAPALNPTLRQFDAERRGTRDDVHAAPAGRCVPVEMPAVDASASEIREMLRGGADAGREHRLRQVLPAGVLDYIRAQRLYTPD